MSGSPQGFQESLGFTAGGLANCWGDVAKNGKKKAGMTLGPVGQRSARHFCEWPDSYYLTLCGPYRVQLLKPDIAM